VQFDFENNKELTVKIEIKIKQKKK